MTGIRPFSNGSEYQGWVGRNCRGCLYYSGPDDPPTCELDMALGVAMMADGTIPDTIATRLGCHNNNLGYPATDCPERLT